MKTLRKATLKLSLYLTWQGQSALVSKGNFVEAVQVLGAGGGRERAGEV